MIIAAKIVLTDVEFQHLKEKEMDIEEAMSILGRLRAAVKRGDYEQYAWVDDHATDPETGMIVDAGKIEVRLDK